MNPYQTLPETAFWKTAVATKSLFDINTLWKPKFPVTPRQDVITFGSCFAQHIGKAFQERGYAWLNTEPAPRALSPEHCKIYNYGIFSCRTGNLYTTSLLRQWVEWALEIKTPPEECWESQGRFYDPFRPNIEPNGFESREEMLASRTQTLRCFKDAIQRAKLFVFTMGLTESWFNKAYDCEYPMCPGTVAGEFYQDKHLFLNQDFLFVHRNLMKSIELIRRVNKNVRFILTVSPVPLTATNSGHHVAVATMESKSILRAVAGQVVKTRPYVDYFPSYEIINSPVFKGVFFEPNQRNVNPWGVNFVMEQFFRSLGDDALGKGSGSKLEVEKHPPVSHQVKSEDVVCEEELLAAFGTRV